MVTSKIEMIEKDTGNVIRIITPSGKEFEIKIVEPAESLHIKVSGTMTIHPMGMDQALIANTEF